MNSNSSIFDSFRVKFTLKPGSRDTPSFFSWSKNRIFICFFVIYDLIAPEILVEKVWYFNEY